MSRFPAPLLQPVNEICKVMFPFECQTCQNGYSNDVKVQLFKGSFNLDGIKRNLGFDISLLSYCVSEVNILIDE